MEDRQRFLSGLFGHYPSYALDDFATISRGSAMLVLVLPKVIIIILILYTLLLLLIKCTDQVAWELKQDYRSNCGQYSLLESCNILAEYCNASILRQLQLPDEDVTVPFLKSFPKQIRLIGNYYIRNNSNFKFNSNYSLLLFSFSLHSNFEHA